MAKAAKAAKAIKQEPLEKQLWKAACKLQKNIDAAEYKHVVLGLIFLKYIFDAFEELHGRLETGEGELAGADPEDKDEYQAENVFFVPAEARWPYLVARAKQPDIGTHVDAAMDAIEQENPSLKGVLPKVYARQNLDPTSLGELIDLIGNIALGDAKARSRDVLGHVFEYFLGEFALAEGKQGGQFYTPRSIVELLVNMLEPYQGRVFDPCCGSGGMFVQSEKFVEEHQGRISDISIYGQESNQTTWRLAKMNLAIRGIDSSQVKWNNEGSFLNDAHQDLKADFIIANPPFNVSDWSGEQLRGDARWQYGAPPPGNANFAWLQHFVYHLSPTGIAGVVLAKGALTSKTSGEGDIRKRLITDGNLIDCIVNLPAKLFLNTQIPAALWFMNRNRAGIDIGGHTGTTVGANDVRANKHLPQQHPRPHEILFIDARNLGHLINRRTRELSHDDIQKIADTYHAWRTADPSPPVGAHCMRPDGTRPDDVVDEMEMDEIGADAMRADAIRPYGDVRGFCASVPISRVAELDYVLTPGRYVGLPDEEDDFNFPERFAALKAEFEVQLQEEEALNQAIMESLARVKV
ncbi:type I restriction enzyme M protein [Nitrosomonas oligotropha]|uniref:site-specific DNA-methyltransferase (adenine-specific) n=1 Tax=Nitrosomonas oligotropha TaxID=42354 RepID=A0A2T5I114_9PROT|nr:class I SAM-dependent DNA methyltransferase [Nitrosomonas oligotropha]PTQ77520.1 type I restriction enzyme M protein [Nitrosomonas oligotropha]